MMFPQLLKFNWKLTEMDQLDTWMSSGLTFYIYIKMDESFTSNSLYFEGKNLRRARAACECCWAFEIRLAQLEVVRLVLVENMTFYFIVWIKR